LARTLAPSPHLLLLDEPFSSLDTDLRGRIRQSVHDITRQLGLTTLLITHDISDAIAMADELLFLRDGQPEARCDTPQLFRTKVPDRLQRALEEMEREARRITDLCGG
ncbi:MAG: ABC transporter ATP-binding protein, partial [Bacteroidota bacterium]